MENSSTIVFPQRRKSIIQHTEKPSRINELTFTAYVIVEL